MATRETPGPPLADLRRRRCRHRTETGRARRRLVL